MEKQIFLIPSDLVHRLGNYLAQMPYAQVQGFIAELSKCQVVTMADPASTQPAAPVDTDHVN